MKKNKLFWILTVVCVLPILLGTATKTQDLILNHGAAGSTVWPLSRSESDPAARPIRSVTSAEARRRSQQRAWPHFVSNQNHTEETAYERPQIETIEQR